MAKRKILVTGVANQWGARVAARLLANTDTAGERDDHVIGLDSEPPAFEIKGLDYIQADVRNPLFMDLLRSEGVDTICHLAFTESSRLTEAVFDLNVMGTMKVLGASAEAGVRKVVLKSSLQVYGALPGNPSFLTEQHPLQGGPSRGTTRHLVEIEAFCNGFRRQTPEMIMTVLRFAGVVGPKIDTPLTRFLKQPLAPTLLGFDPLMQVIHENDVVEALVHAIDNDFPGAFNVAAEGILPLSRLTALAGKTQLPLLHPLAYGGASLMRAANLPAGRYYPIEPDYLRYPWVGDLNRMRTELCFTPHYTAEEALREFAGEQRLRRFGPESVEISYDEERLRDTIERRRRARDLSGGTDELQEGEA
jgi:UDP-glucose 4-epimerase